MLLIDGNNPEMVLRSKWEVQTRTLILIAASALLLLQSPRLAAQAREPWFGIWKLDVAKSSSDPDRYKRVTLKIEPWGDGLKVIYDMVGTRGGVTHMEWIGKFDGKDYPVQGVDYVLTNAYRLVDARSYEIVVKVDGAMAATASVTVSPDGKTLTSVTREQDRQSTTVYEK